MEVSFAAGRDTRNMLTANTHNGTGDYPHYRMTPSMPRQDDRQPTVLDSAVPLAKSRAQPVVTTPGNP
jgi:hypothetical protein